MTSAPLQLNYAAISDVGRVRKENQDAGYAGPWLLAVCDGVGGAARGDIASSTAIAELRRLDTEPDGDPKDLLAATLREAHEQIAEIVQDDPSLTSTSTTAVVGLFTGHTLAVANLGDSRAYLLHHGEINRITADHTFVQGLVDEGRISEDEARAHPHRNVILKALDGAHDTIPDLFEVEVVEGDRILICSDGACGVLDDNELAETLAQGTPDYAALELVTRSLDVGSTDNVTCVVADVVLESANQNPQVVGAANAVPRRRPGRIFRRDTGELDPVDADLPELPSHADYAITTDPVDAEHARYAPRAPLRFAWLRRILATVVVLGMVWVAGAAAWVWSQQQYFVSEYDGKVAIYRGIDASLPGVELAKAYETSDIELDRLSEFDASLVENGIDATSLSHAREQLDEFAKRQESQTNSPGSADSTDQSAPSPSDRSASAGT